MDRTSFAVVPVSPDLDFKDRLVSTLIGADYQVLAPPGNAPLLESLPEGHPTVVIADVRSGFDFTVDQLLQFKGRHPVSWITLLTVENRVDELVRAFRPIREAFSISLITCETLADSIALALLAPEHLPPAFLALLYPQDSGAETNGSFESQALATTLRNRDGLQSRSGCCDPLLLHAGSCEDDVSPDRPAMSEPAGRPILSSRQTFILKCLLEGDSNKEIARKIRVSEGTVKIHIQRLLRRLGVRNRTEAAVWAFERRYER
jgi:two-component system nitrate/nitrite response regulator NarL